MIHFYTDYQPADAGGKLRHKVAHITWSTQLWRELPLTMDKLPRVWKEEGRTYPYLKDLFDAACSIATSDMDVCVYTNSDICVCSDCAIKIAEAMQSTDAAYCFRRDFNTDIHEPVPDEVIARAVDYVGSDLYAFRRFWWRRFRDEFPDMLTGHEAGDPCLRVLIDQTNPKKPTCLKNLIYHRRHNSWWEQPGNRYRLKGQLHNLSLAREWLKAHAMNPAVFGIK